MSSRSPSPASRDGLSRPDLGFERFEYLASPREPARSRSSGTETGLPETHYTPVHGRDPQTDTKPKRPGYDWDGSWAWEIASVTLSVTGIALLVAFLVTINNTPYEDWKYTASPNTVVSIIVTITKAALFVPVSSCLGQLKWNLFQSSAPLYHMQVLDQASRGPWGSLEVLLRGIFGSKTGILTYIGASITILALAVDPFAQQVLVFSPRTLPAPNATAFTETSQSFYEGGSDISDVHFELPPRLLSAIIGGILQTHSPLEPRCNTGTCNFPEFYSLGMCSKCEDVTAQTNQTCRGTDPAFWADIPIHPALKNITTNCTYQAPNNFSFDFEEFPQFSYGSAYSPPDSDPYKNDNITLPMGQWSLRSREGGPILDIQAPIVSLFEVDYTNPVFYYASNATAPPTKPLVTECAVYLCERKYPAITYVPGDQNSSPVHVADTQELIAQDVPEESMTSFLATPLYLVPPNGVRSLSPQDPEYSIDHLTFNSFKPLMMSLFNSTYNMNRWNLSTSDTFRLATFLRRNDISEVLDSMTTGVTDVIRTSQDGTAVSGEGFRDETFIHVRWPWIILPVVVTSGSVALLLGTAIGSKQKKVLLWKCMILPLITSHLDTTPENGIASVRRVDGMTDMSKKMRAVVVQDDGPITFKEKEN